MALLIPDGYALALWEFSSNAGTQPFATTCGIGLPNDDSNLVGTCNDMMNAYSTNLLQFTTQDLSLDRVTLRIAGPGGTTGSVESTLTALPGTQTGNFAPVAMAGIVRKITNVPGRAGRGRMFIPGSVPESEVDINGTVSTGLRTDLAGGVTDMFTDLQGSQPGLNPVLLHDENSPVSAPSSIVDFSASPLVGWIGKRIR